MAYQLNKTQPPSVYGHRTQIADLAAAGSVIDFGVPMSCFKITGYCKAGAAGVSATLALSDTVGMGTPVNVGVLNLAIGGSGFEHVFSNPAGHRYGRVTVAGGTMDVRLDAAQ